VQGKRFSKQHQPQRRRGRPPGATNLIPREVTETILIGFSELGEDLHGKDGLVGFIKRIGCNDLKSSAMLLRGLMTTQVRIEKKEEVVYQTVDQARADLERAGIPIDRVFKLEHIKQPLVDVKVTKATDDGRKADDPLKDDK
jgi:hypothetical protein